MSTRKILFQNSFWLGLVEVMSKLIMFGVTVSMVRYFGPKEFGAYNLSAAYVSLFLIMADFGMTTIATREMAKVKETTQKYFSNLLSLRLILGGLTLIIIFISTFVINSSQSRGLIMAVGVYQLCQSANGIMTSIFIAWEKMEMVFMTKMSFFAGIFLATFWTINQNGRVVDLAINYVLMTIVSLIISLWFIKKLNIKIVLEFDKKFIFKLVMETLPLLGTIIVATIYANIDTLLIGRYWGQEKVGYYQAAYKILFAFQSINFINNAIFPRMSVLVYEKNTIILSKLLKFVIGFSLIGLIPLALMITFGREVIVTKIYGSNYLIASGVMAILIWSGVINYFRILLSNLLMAQGRQKFIFYAVFLGMLVNFGLNFILIPRLGFTFAATSLLISEGVILMVLIGVLKREKYTIVSSKRKVKII